MYSQTIVSGVHFILAFPQEHNNNSNNHHNNTRKFKLLGNSCTTIGKDGRPCVISGSEWHKICSSGLEFPHCCPSVATTPDQYFHGHPLNDSNCEPWTANPIGEKLSDVSFQDPEIQDFPATPLRVVPVTGRFRSARVAFWKEPLHFIPTFFKQKFHCSSPAIVNWSSIGASPERFEEDLPWPQPQRNCMESLCIGARQVRRREPPPRLWRRRRKKKKR